MRQVTLALARALLAAPALAQVSRFDMEPPRPASAGTRRAGTLGRLRWASVVLVGQGDRLRRHPAWRRRTFR